MSGKGGPSRKDSLRQNVWEAVSRRSGRLGTSQPTIPWPETPASNHVPCEHGWAGSVRAAVPPGQGCDAHASIRHATDYLLWLPTDTMLIFFKKNKETILIYSPQSDKKASNLRKASLDTILRRSSPGDTIQILCWAAAGEYQILF